MIDTPLQTTTFERQELTETTMMESTSDFLTTLINTCVAQQEPIVIILDEDHAITDSTLHREMSSLIEHLPPHIHIVLSTRVDALRITRYEQHSVRADTIEPLEEQNMLPEPLSQHGESYKVPKIQQNRPSQPLLDPLSARELEVLQLMAQGASNVEIANDLIIAFATVKRHVSNILSKLQATNRTQAVAYARHLSLL